MHELELIMTVEVVFAPEVAQDVTEAYQQSVSDSLDKILRQSVSFLADA